MKGDKKLATISDVARLSGLSVSTVSRVINNKPHVSEEKKRKVKEAMDALGYSPLQAARQMRGSGSGNIAVSIPRVSRTASLHIWLILLREHAGSTITEH